MTQDNKPSIAPMKEQITYANILQWGAWGGIVTMVITYFIYMAGIFEPNVPVEVVVANWGHGVDEFLHATNSPHGWGWVSLLGKGDFLNFIGIAFLAALTIGCYLVLIPGFLRRNDKVYAIIAILEVVVLTVAASGLLGSGGH